MREFIDIVENSFLTESWKTLYWFWYHPKNKTLVEVDGTHASTAKSELGYSSSHEYDDDEALDLEDDTLIAAAISDGWVRGRFGEQNEGGWARGGSDLSLQGLKDNVLQAAIDISKRRRIKTLYVDFGSTDQMESHKLVGKDLNTFLQSGVVNDPIDHGQLYRVNMMMSFEGNQEREYTRFVRAKSSEEASSKGTEALRRELPSFEMNISDVTAEVHT